MKEHFLQFILKMQLFQAAQLRIVFDEIVHVFKPGLENKNQGPDLLNASHEVEGSLWVGPAKIHLKNSDGCAYLHQFESN